MIEKVEHEGKLLALVLRHECVTEGVQFFTEADNPLQLGVMKHKQGHLIKPHVHLDAPKMIKVTQEVLHIEYGKVAAGFYTNDGHKASSVILCEGDTIILLNGCHGFSILEDAKILEIKQGPYLGVAQDKEYVNFDAGDQGEHK